MLSHRTRSPLARASLMAALLLCLTACGENLKPQPPPSLPPEVPRVDCEKGWADDPKPPPRAFDPVTWSAWARTVLGGWELDRKLRREERQCVRDLKGKGVIR